VDDVELHAVGLAQPVNHAVCFVDHLGPDAVSRDHCDGLHGRCPSVLHRGTRALEIFHGCSVLYAQRLISMAIPCPPPMHALAMPYVFLRAASSRASVSTSRVPVAPSGCPSAMAPPFTFTFSRSRPRSFSTARYCAANASLISNRSMSFKESLVFSSSPRMAG